MGDVITSDNFFITLISSDHGIKSVKNTLTKFENYLERPLNFNHQEWSVALSCITMHSEIASPAPWVPFYIYVNCDIIKEQNGQDKYIAIFAVKEPKPGQKILRYEPKNKIYYDLSTFYIERILIELVGGNQKPKQFPINIRLYSGQPTVVVLHFKRKIMQRPQFVLNCSSFSEQNRLLFPENQCNNFKSYLGPSYKFNVNDGGLFEVALTQITYQPRLKNRLQVPFTLDVYTTADANPKSLIIQQDVRLTTKRRLITTMNNMFRQIKEQNPTVPTILMDIENEKYQIGASANCLISLPLYFMYTLGFRNFTRPKFVTLEEGNNKKYLLQLRANQPVQAEEEFKINAYKPDLAFLYCDFVQSSIVGGSTAPILKAFPIEYFKATNYKYITHEVKNLEYYPLKKFDLSTVQFSLRDISGNELPFEDKKANLVLTLLVRYTPRLF